MIQTPDYTSLTVPFCKRNFDHWHSHSVSLNYPVIEESSLQFLETWALLTKPSRVLELGCGFGLMSNRLLSVLPELKLTGIDYNQANFDVFSGLTNEPEILNRFSFVAGNVMDLLTEHEGVYDWIIVDVDKKFYPGLISLLPEKLNTGGYLIADNVLWKGWVINRGEKKNPEPIRRWNDLIFSHKSFESVLIPVGDGLTLSRKI